MNQIINLRNEIESRYNLIQLIEEKTKDALNQLPEGRIKIKKRDQDTNYYLVVGDNKEKWLKKDNKELIESLIQKNYLQKVNRAAEKEIEKLKQVLKTYPKTVAEEVYEHLPKERKMFVKPIVPTDDQFRERWESQTYPVKPVKEGMPVFKTLKGDLVKSKSEVLIADRLFANGIPYKYECPINVGGIIFHPDFTILRMSDRKILYLEHCGKVGDAEYAEDMVSRANRYSLAGIMQGDSLFFTFETSKTPLDTEVIDKMIENCFR